MGCYRHRLVFCALVLLTPNLAAGATLYVRQGGTGSKNGSDWTNACTAFSGSCALARGNTYYVGVGNYTGFRMYGGLPGTTPVVIKKATVADHGTSTGWNDSYAQQAVFLEWQVFVDISDLTFDGQERASPTSGYGFKFVSATAGIGSPIAIIAESANIANITLRYIEIQGSGMNSGDVDRGIEVKRNSQPTPTINNVTIQSVYVHDMDSALLLTRGIQTLLVEDSVFARNTSSAASHAEGWSLAGDDNLTFRNNLMLDVEGTGGIVCLGGDDGSCNNVSIYGNVFAYSEGNPYNRSGWGAGVITCINGMTCNGWVIYNNTIVNQQYGLSARVHFSEGVASPAPIVKNNLWYCSGANCNNAGHNSVTADYNWYSTAISHTTETNEQTSAANPFVNWPNGNFHLIGPTKPGTPLTLPAGVTTDPMGAPRGIDGVWDRGAFEFKRSDPPTNLRTGS